MYEKIIRPEFPLFIIHGVSIEAAGVNHAVCKCLSSPLLTFLINHFDYKLIIFTDT